MVRILRLNRGSNGICVQAVCQIVVGMPLEIGFQMRYSYRACIPTFSSIEIPSSLTAKAFASMYSR